MIALGASAQLFAASATVYVMQATPAAQRGPALSAYNAGFIGFVPAGAFVVAAIATTAGTRWALIGPGLAIVIGAIAVAARTRAAVRTEATADAATAAHGPG
jgi:MFS family permease